MVFETLTQAGKGGLGFALAFMQESLSRGAASRPWLLVEGPGDKHLFVGGMPRELRQAVRDRRVFWLRASREEALPELVQILLESSLCEGVLLRGFERFKGEHQARVWMRRWQLSSEKTHTHLLWVHERPCEVTSANLRVEWKTPTSWSVRRGDGLLQSTSFQTLQALRSKTNSLPRRQDADRETTRTA